MNRFKPVNVELTAEQQAEAERAEGKLAYVGMIYNSRAADQEPQSLAPALNLRSICL